MSSRSKYLTLFSCFVLYLIVGCNYLWGFISTYVLSYYIQECGQNIEISTINMIFPFGSLVGVLVMPFSVKLGKFFKFKNYFMITGFLMASCFLAISFSNNFWLFFLFFGLIYSMIHGVTYMIPLYCAPKMFYKQKGFVNGICLLGMGLSSSFGGFLIRLFINPNNIEPQKIGDQKIFPKEVNERFPFAMRTFSFYLYGLTIISYLVFQEKNLEKDDIISEGNEGLTIIENEEQIENLEEYQKVENQEIIINDHRFYKYPSSFILLICLFSTVTFGYNILSNYKSYGLEYIPDDAFLTTVGSVGMIMNALSRLTFGKLVDHFNFEYLYSFVACGNIILAFTLRYALESKTLYFIYVNFILILMGSHYTLFPYISIKIFGLETGHKALALMMWGFSFANFNQFFLTKYAKDKIGNNYFFLIFGLISAFGFFMCLLNTIILRRKIKQNEKINPKRLLKN